MAALSVTLAAADGTTRTVTLNVPVAAVNPVTYPGKATYPGKTTYPTKGV